MSRGMLVRLEAKVTKEMLVSKVLLAQLVETERREMTDWQVLWDKKENQEPPAVKDQKVMPELPELLELPDQLEPLERLEQTERMV